MGTDRRRRWGALPLLGLLLGQASAAMASAPPTPLYVVPTEDRLQLAVPIEQGLRVEFEAVDRERLLRVLGPGAIAAGASSVRFVVEEAPGRSYAPDDRWLAASFIVDHDQPAIVALREEFLREAGGDAAERRRDLVAFVEHKVDATHGQGWEPASLTARALRGDCTEHAVLTAAMARSLGIPARVVVGMVIVRPADRYATVGHAWAELRVGDRWAIADAALGAAGADARYVPLGLLEDEGPGFLVQMVDTLGAWVTRVVVLGPAD
ncbi:MAG TPA: transglutaminase-like domain-containing protein [Steroidobacteraceae bacterium]|nr:transglutaminase-like domain-containing protein [Steroidobacteraceae bacterium]